MKIMEQKKSKRVIIIRLSEREAIELMDHFGGEEDMEDITDKMYWELSKVLSDSE
jgi:hypothetical protein